MKYKIPLAIDTWDDEEKQAINEVVLKGRFTMGENVKRFEKAFSNYLNSKYCVMVNSGSSANLLMIASLFYTRDQDKKLSKGDEVIVPAVSWSTSYYPLYQYGLKLKFVDIDLFTLNYDLEKLKNAVTTKTKVILAVNLLGNSNEFSKINQIISGKKIILLEDNCESLGAQYLKKQTGTFGLLGTFSFFFSHHISTMEGGMISTNDEEIYHILLSLRSHGWTRELPKQNYVSKLKSDNLFEESFKFVLPGYNLRPLEMSGAVGLIQLKKLPKFLKNRRSNAKLFKEVMKEKKDFIIQKEIGLSSWFGFSLILSKKANLNRQHIIKKLIDLGFEVRPIVGGNFTKNLVTNYFNKEIHDKLDNAEWLNENGLYIGNHHVLMSDEINSLKYL